MATIFVSYSQADRASAKPLADFLIGSGYRVWWDVGLRPGDNFTIEIQQQIQKADHVIVIWSRTAAASFWVTAEATYARTCGKPLMPLRIDDCAPPVPFNLLQTKLIGPIERDGPEIVAALRAAGTLPQMASASEVDDDMAMREKVLRKAQELARWDFIKGSNQAQHFRTFLARFPDGDLADLAQMRLESLRWEEISRTRATDELRTFVAEFPRGVKTPEAQRILDRRRRAAELEAWSKMRHGFLGWTRKRADRRLAEYDSFLAQYPSGDYALQAAEIAKELRCEVQLWLQAQESDDSAVVERYLSTYPRGSYVSEAKARLARLRRQISSKRSDAGGPKPEFPLAAFVSLAFLAALLGATGALLGARSDAFVTLPFRSLDGEVYYFLHPYPILLGIFIAVLIHEWGNRSWITTLFAFAAVLVFRFVSQVLVTENDEPGFPLNSMLIGALYCFGAWVSGFIVAPYMRASIPVFFASILLGALAYPDWPVALGLPFPGHETVTASIFFVACTMPIAFSLLRAQPRSQFVPAEAIRAGASS